MYILKYCEICITVLESVFHRQYLVLVKDRHITSCNILICTICSLLTLYLYSGLTPIIFIQICGEIVCVMMVVCDFKLNKILPLCS